MNATAHKVGLAAAFGAGVGALVAHSLSPWLWWLGLFAGALVGYLSYEWKAVVRAMPQAYRAATSWRPPEGAFSAYGWSVALLSFVMAWILGLMFLMGTHAERLSLLKIPESPDQLAVMSMTILLMSSTCLVPVNAASEFLDTSRKLRVACTYVFPPLLAFHLLRLVFQIIKFAVLNIPAMVRAIGRALVDFGRFCARFGWQIFVRIHSEQRLICAADACLGAAVGHILGRGHGYALATTIGASAGYVLGFVNYAVVTERWLRPKGYITG